jgi:hypothetical protein
MMGNKKWLMDKFFIEAEYVAALDPFAPGELSFDGGRSLEPKAWNIELAYALTDRLEAALRYEGSDDGGGGGDWIPEKQYGAAVRYGIFAHTTLALEYLHGEFETGDERDAVAAQLTVKF